MYVCIAHTSGVLKGVHAVLKGRGVNACGMNTEKKKETLGSHPDFKNKKSKVKLFFHQSERRVKMLPAHVQYAVLQGNKFSLVFGL